MAILNRIFRSPQKPATAAGDAVARKQAGAEPSSARAFIEAKQPSQRTYFFVGGHPRSGTNWISNLCNLHPDICCHGEFHFEIMYEALSRFTGKPWYLASEPRVKSVASAAVDELVRKSLDAMADARKPGARVVGDHTPKPLQTMLEDAAYIVATRDGRDVIVSWTFHLLRTGMVDIVHEACRDTFQREVSAGMQDPEKLTTAAKHLLRDQEWVTRLGSGWSLEIQNDWPQLAAIKASGSRSRAMVVRYEDLIRDVETTRAGIYEFLGAAPGKAAPVSRETKTLPGFEREDPKSFYRKGEAGDWKNYFDERSAQWFKACAAQQLIEAGYEKDDRW